MIIGDIADRLTRGVEATVKSVNGALFEQTLRLGVTGLSRAGKTVFITSLVANLMNTGRMPGLRAVAEGRLRTARLQPQPDNIVPRFDFENHLASLTGTEPAWPDGTNGISELRLSFRYQPAGLLAGLQGTQVLHLDIVDYPGEWLLDLGLLDKSFRVWSDEVLEKCAEREESEAFRAELAGVDPNAALDESAAKSLASAYTDYLHGLRGADYSDCTPGRFLLPGDLKGSPVLTFAPLPSSATGRGSLAREFERRFEAYKREVVKPFFRNHFARIDRQIVLVDMLGAIHAGPRAVQDMRHGIADILGAFRPGRNSFLSQIFLGKRIEKILFAATKADHLHHSQHDELTAIAQAFLADAKARAEFAGAETEAISIASLRATSEDQIEADGRSLDVVRGTLLETGKSVAMFAGRLPSDPARLLSQAQQGTEVWLAEDFNVMGFAPQPLTVKDGRGPPHIRLDRAAEFLIGDKLR